MRASFDQAQRAAAFPQFMAPEKRTPAQFMKELDKYRSELETFAAQLLRQTAVKAVFQLPLRFRIFNPGDVALEDVLVKISTPQWLEQHFTVPEIDKPVEPAGWGDIRPFSLRIPRVANLMAAALPQAQLHAGVWVSGLRVSLLHADTAEWLDEIAFIAVNPPDAAEAEIKVEITAKNRRGTARHSRRIIVSDSLSWGQLVSSAPGM